MQSAAYLSCMTTLVAWDDGEPSVPLRPHRRRNWVAGLVLVVAIVAVGSSLIVRAAMGVADDGCRLHEAREGIPGIEKLGVPGVGQQPQTGWDPPANVHVRYVKTDAGLPGAVVDETMCGQPRGQLLVSIAR